MTSKSMPFDPAKTYTISELRTLRTRYGHAARQLEDIHTTVSALKLKYSGKQARSNVKAEEERYRILGIDDALNVIKEKKMQNEAVIAILEKQYEAAPKYGKKNG